MIIDVINYQKPGTEMVQMSSASSLPDLKTRNEVPDSRDDVPKSRDLGTSSHVTSSRDLKLEDVDDSRLYDHSSEDRRSSLYLQNHAVTNSDKACEVLKVSFVRTMIVEFCFI